MKRLLVVGLLSAWVALAPGGAGLSENADAYVLEPEIPFGSKAIPVQGGGSSARTVLAIACPTVKEGDIVDVRGVTQVTNASTPAASSFVGIGSYIEAAYSGGPWSRVARAVQPGHIAYAAELLVERTGMERVPSDGDETPGEMLERCYRFVMYAWSSWSPNIWNVRAQAGVMEIGVLGQPPGEYVSLAQPSNEVPPDDPAQCQLAWPSYVPQHVQNRACPLPVTQGAPFAEVVAHSTCTTEALEAGDVVDVRALYEVSNDAGYNNGVNVAANSYIKARLEGEPSGSGREIAQRTRNGVHPTAMHHYVGERRVFDRVPVGGRWCYDLILYAHISACPAPSYPRCMLAIEGNPPNGTGYGRVAAAVIGKEGPPPGGTGVERFQSDTNAAPSVRVWKAGQGPTYHVPHSVCVDLAGDEVVDVRGLFSVTNPLPFGAMNYQIYVGSFITRSPDVPSAGGAVIAKATFDGLLPGRTWMSDDRTAIEELDLVGGAGRWCYNLVLYAISASAPAGGVHTLTTGNGRVAIAVRSPGVS